ncbi:MAG: hypothetical protein Q4Q62_05380, partial [Thermoplasmata archaeon]|nr:hypothetical protein [Thermoplasmata archaeon]
THDEWVTYHGTQGEANGDAMSQWLHLTPRERKRRHVHVGYNEDLCFHLDGSYYVPDGCWDSDELPEEDTVDEVTTIAKISSGGSSLQLNLTRELKALGLDRGDRVEVTLRRI